MAIISEIIRLERRVLFFVFLLIGALICSGSLLIFIFENDVFMNTEILKLLILSIGITIPFFILNTMALSMIKQRNITEEKHLFEAMFGGAMLTFLDIYMLIMLWFILRFSINDAMKIGSGMICGSFLVVLCKKKINEMNTKRSK